MRDQLQQFFMKEDGKMNKLRVISILVLSLGLVMGGIGCLETIEEEKPSEELKGEYVPGEILVKFKADVTQEEIEAINESFGVEVIEVLALNGVYRLKIPEESTVPEMIKEYRGIPEVEYANPNYIARIPEGEQRGVPLK